MVQPLFGGSMKFVGKKKTRSKDTAYTHDGHFLLIKLMDHAKIEKTLDGWFSLIIVMKSGKEKFINSSAKREYLIKDMNEINDKIRRLI